MDREILGRRIAERCRLKGEFRLRSGQTADVYFDKYLFEADPVLLWAVAEYAKALIPPDTEVLAGLELGGVPVATALSICTGLPAAFVRKVPKPYGTMKLAEGADVRGRKVVIVEDVITKGGQVVSSTSALRALGSQVEAVLCVIDRRRASRAGRRGPGSTPAVPVRRPPFLNTQGPCPLTRASRATRPAIRQQQRDP